jgi:outer membrane protein assembly factor BamB
VTRLTRTVSLCLLLVSAAASNVSAEEPNALANFISAQLSTRKGLALDIGCGDASLDLALARLTELNIECISADQASVDAARANILATGLYGTRVSADLDSVGKLNFPDNCATLVIAGDQFASGKGERDVAEFLRVLSPNGTAVIGQSTAAAQRSKMPLTRAELEDWLKTAGVADFKIIEKDGIWAHFTKSFAGRGWDEWTHRMHDAANTYSSNDTVTGTNFKAQWVSDYRPGLSSAAVVVGDGKVVVASLEYADDPEQTPYIQTLDAFTGMELWSRVGKKNLPISRPPGIYSNRESCSDIAIASDSLFLLGKNVCHRFNLDSGATTASIPIPPEAHPADDDVWLYLSVNGGMIFGGVGRPPGVKIDWSTMHYRGVCSSVFALTLNDQKLAWVSSIPLTTSSLAAGGDKLYFCDQTLKLHALNQKDGAEAWAAESGLEPGTEVVGAAVYQDKLWILHNPPDKDKKGNALSALDLVVKGRNDRLLDAFSTKDGKHLFACNFGQTIAGFSFSRNTVIGARQHGATDAGGQGMGLADALNGNFKWLEPPGVKLRCTPTLATPNLIIRRGPGPNQVIDFNSLIDPAQVPKVSTFAGYRSSCTYPAIPAYGMLYIQGEGCACQSPIRGNIALTPGSPGPITTTQRLTRGSAFGQELPAAEGNSWASCRADVSRSGQCDEAAPETPLREHWAVKLNGTIAPLSAGNGRVFCASSDRTVSTLDLHSGKALWRYVSGGGIYASPFLENGRLYVSGDDGIAHALRADTGAEIWNFRAALGTERMIGYGQFVSRWPAWGGVLVHDGVAYIPSGYFPDDGCGVFAIDAITGELKWQKLIDRHENNYRNGFVARGGMALGNNKLYISTGVGTPWLIPLKGKEHAPAMLCSSRDCKVKGEHIMVAGADVICVAPDLEYVHHVKAIEGERRDRLPVLTADAIFELNQEAGGKSLCLISGKRSAFEYAADGNTATYMLKDEFANKPKDALNWAAWQDQPMTTLIKAGGVLFSGGTGKVYATRAADGKELWSAPVPGTEVTDLAWCDGCLLVVTNSGSVVCFGP